MIKKSDVQFVQLLELSKSVRNFNTLLTYKKWITPQQVYIMELCNRNRKVSIKKVKEDLFLSSQSLSRILSKLYEQNIIERNFDIWGDKRVIILSLTDWWKKLYEKIRNDIQTMLSKQFDTIRREKFISWLENIIFCIKHLYTQETLPKT